MYAKGSGLFNKLLNKLPVELHLPGYQYCGPGTKLSKRLARGDPGINNLDRACREHDIAYSKYHSGENRRIADEILAKKAQERVYTSNASLGEKAAALVVSEAMKLKSKIGMGINRKQKAVRKSVKRKTTKVRGGGMKRKNRSKLSTIISAAEKKMKNGVSASTAIASALQSARAAVKKAGGKSNIIIPRIIPIPSKVGGYLPFLIPLFSGLSAVGALVGGAAGVVKAINDLKASKRGAEAVVGGGLYLKPYKDGMGLYTKPLYLQGMGLYTKPLYLQGMGLTLNPYDGDGLQKKKSSL